MVRVEKTDVLTKQESAFIPGFPTLARVPANESGI